MRFHRLSVLVVSDNIPLNLLVLGMAPILYMTLLSPPSRAVLITAQALGIELELKNVDLAKGEHRRPEYLQLNPLHTVPTLIDGETIITDSHAINAYLVRKYSSDDKLYPRDHSKRALVDQRLHFDTGILFNSFRNAAVRTTRREYVHQMIAFFRRRCSTARAKKYRKRRPIRSSKPTGFLKRFWRRTNGRRGEK
jgi:glutathione S-transferase